MPTQNLSKDINDDIKINFSSGRTNHLADLWLNIIGTLASFAATILAVAEMSKWTTASAAAVATVCVAIQRNLDLRRKAIWYFSKSAKLRAVEIELSYGNLSVQEGARKYSHIETTMEDQWANLGQQPTKPNAEPDSA